jgi:prefoldin subunit 5
MKKSEYYESTLKDLKKEQGRETQTLKSLHEIHDHLQRQRYKSIDRLEGVIKELETRRGEVKGAIKRLEELVK